MEYFKKKKISLAKQYFAINSKYSNMIETKHLYKSNYEIVLIINPLSNSRKYKVLLTQTIWKKPKIYILEPNIHEITNGKRPPHVYEFGESVCRLCLFLPDELRAYEYYDKIIPWISEWLAHFEIWLITNNWCGGGHISDSLSKDDK